MVRSKLVRPKLCPEVAAGMVRAKLGSRCESVREVACDDPRCVLVFGYVRDLWGRKESGRIGVTPSGELVMVGMPVLSGELCKIAWE